MACTSENNAIASSTLCSSLDAHSVSSPSSSSTSSIFSIDAPSSQSSTASSSTSSVNVIWTNELQNWGFPPSRHGYSQGGSAVSSENLLRLNSGITKNGQPEQALSQVVAPESRKNPRRTHRGSQGNDQASDISSAVPRPPPALVRQCERKDNFVDNLVDTTTQMIETIWPLSVLSCSRETVVNGKDQNLIGLRTFVQEVLRRSKTSYSTLQVSLYYLILIQSCIPKHDFTMEQLEDSSSCRAMQCGRRMFLSALILASKYLQDRNFSARAWSKISGLKTVEINTNEMAFLSAVKWKLHIPEPVFHRWTDIVLKYSPSSSKLQSNSPNRWKKIIPLLTPDLDPLAFGMATISNNTRRSSVSEKSESTPLAAIPLRFKTPACLGSNEQTPTNPYKIPKVLEPAPRRTEMNTQILPSLPRLGLLPTPTMTPQTGTFGTPAVSAFGPCSGRSSMSIAMAQVQSNCLARSTLDNPNFGKPISSDSVLRPARKPSSSTLSSPESMISDASTRSSRSSSISSVASSTCALPQPRLAVQATLRCANMKLATQKENCGPSVRSSPRDELSWEAFTSPDAISTNEGDYFTRPSHGQPKESRHFQPDGKIPDGLERNLVKGQNVSAQEAATALRDLAINRHRILPSPSVSLESRKRQHSTSRASYDQSFGKNSGVNGISATPRNSRKRERPSSTDLSVLATVRDLIAPRRLGDITNNKSSSWNDNMVAPDTKIAESFMLRENNQVKCFDNELKKCLGKHGSPRKKACGVASTQDEVRAIHRLILEWEQAPRPGMWDGIF